MRPRHVLLAILTAVIWGCNFVAIDIGVASVPPFLFLALRFTAVLIPAIFFVPKPNVPWRILLLVGTFMSLGQFALLYLALWMGMPAGLASLVLQSQAVLTVIIAAVVLREHPTPAQLVGLCLGFAGLVVVGVGHSAATPALALLVTIAAATSWAIGNVLVRATGVAGGLSMTVWSGLVVPLPMLALSLLVDGPTAVGDALAHFPVSALLSTLFTAWGASLVGYSIWNTLLAKYPAGQVSSFALLVPVFGLLSAWVAFGETPQVLEAVGGAILLLGVAVTTGLLRAPAWLTRSRPPRT